ncbi:hypothetical protein RDSD_002949 [Oleidesulfovibrio alaskensis]
MKKADNTIRPFCGNPNNILYCQIIPYWHNCRRAITGHSSEIIISIRSGGTVKKNSPSLSVRLDSVSLGLLQKVSDNAGCSREDMAADIIRSYLQPYQPPDPRFDKSRRVSPRKPVQITGAINVPGAVNEINYKPVQVKDISLGGLGAEVPCSSHELSKALRAMKAFEILFALPGTQDLLGFECTVAYVQINGICRFGGRFVTPSRQSLNKLMELLAAPYLSMQPPPVSCRQKQHLSGYPTDS